MINQTKNIGRRLLVTFLTVAMIVSMGLFCVFAIGAAGEADPGNGSGPSFSLSAEPPADASHTGHDGWEALSQSMLTGGDFTLEGGKKYYLTENIEFSAGQLICEGEATLCLNGYRFTVPHGVTVNKMEAVLTLCDCNSTQGSHPYTVSEDPLTRGLYRFIESGSDSISGGVLTARVNVVGTFNMAGGTIAGSQVTGNGGAVWVLTSGTFNMYGGTIAGNLAGNGGGVFVTGDGINPHENAFNMYGGTIENNSATTNGGGVYVNGRAQFNMVSGRISGNRAANGGGVSFYSDYRSMLSGGTIENNSATTNGGGVQVGAASGGEPVTLNGTRVSGNSAVNGGGIAVESAGYVVLAEGSTVGQNRAEEIALPPFQMPGSVYRRSGGDGVYVTADSRVEMTGGTIGDAEAVDPGLIGVYVAANGGGRVNFTMSGGTITGFASVGVYMEKGRAAMSGGAIKENGSQADGGYGGVCMADGEFTMSGSAEISSNQSDSGGVVVSGGTFTMNDSSKIDGNEASGVGGGVYVLAGTFTMGESASVSGNTAIRGGGVCVDGGTFTMSGANAAISGNKTAGSTGERTGGGVFINNAGEFTMSAGRIENNSAGNQGGGVFMTGGAFTMSGGTVTGNTASAGSGLYASYNGMPVTFTMEGGTITGNSTVDADAHPVYLDGASGAIAGGTVEGLHVTSGVFGRTLNITGGYITAAGLNGTNLTISGGYFAEQNYSKDNTVAQDGARIVAGVYLQSGHVIADLSKDNTGDGFGDSMYRTEYPLAVYSGNVQDLVIEGTFSKVYDGTPIDPGEMNVTVKAGAEDLTERIIWAIAGEHAAPYNVGEYKYTATVQGVKPDGAEKIYNTYNGGQVNFTITEAEATVTISAAGATGSGTSGSPFTAVYNGESHKGKLSASVSGVITQANGTQETVDLSEYIQWNIRSGGDADVIGAGSYTATVDLSSLGWAKNYKLTFSPASMVYYNISKATAQIQWTPQEGVSGDGSERTPFTAGYDGHTHTNRLGAQVTVLTADGSQTVSLDLDWKNTSGGDAGVFDAGDYTVSAVLGKQDWLANYNVTGGMVFYTVSRASINVPIAIASGANEKVSGEGTDSDPFTAVYDGNSHRANLYAEALVITANATGDGSPTQMQVDLYHCLAWTPVRSGNANLTDAGEYRVDLMDLTGMDNYEWSRNYIVTYTPVYYTIAKQEVAIEWSAAAGITQSGSTYTAEYSGADWIERLYPFVTISNRRTELTAAWTKADSSALTAAVDVGTYTITADPSSLGTATLKNYSVTGETVVTLQVTPAVNTVTYAGPTSGRFFVHQQENHDHAADLPNATARFNGAITWQYKLKDGDTWTNLYDSEGNCTLGTEILGSDAISVRAVSAADSGGNYTAATGAEIAVDVYIQIDRPTVVNKTYSIDEGSVTVELKEDSLVKNGKYNSSEVKAYVFAGTMETSKAGTFTFTVTLQDGFCWGVAGNSVALDVITLTWSTNLATSYWQQIELTGDGILYRGIDGALPEGTDPAKLFTAIAAYGEEVSFSQIGADKITITYAANNAATGEASGDYMAWADFLSNHPGYIGIVHVQFTVEESEQYTALTGHLHIYIYQELERPAFASNAHGETSACTFDGSDHTPVFNLSEADGVLIDGPSGQVRDAGKYTYTFILEDYYVWQPTSSSDAHERGDLELTFTVNKAQVDWSQISVISDGTDEVDHQHDRGVVQVTLTYDGAAHSYKCFTLTGLPIGLNGWTPNEDLASAAVKNVGTHTFSGSITLTGPDAKNYEESTLTRNVSVTFIVNQREVNITWAGSGHTFVYAGTKTLQNASEVIKPTANGILEADKTNVGLAVDWANANCDVAGEHTVTATLTGDGAGNYKIVGGATCSYIVTPKSIGLREQVGSNIVASISGSDTAVYNGKAHEVTLDITYTDVETLTNDLDFTVAYFGNDGGRLGRAYEQLIEARVYTIVAYGQGNYEGVLHFTFTVTPYDLSSSTQITGIPQNLVYNGQDQSSALNGLSIEDTNFADIAAYLDGTGSVNGLQFVIPDDMVAAGTYTVALRPTNGNFTGEVTATVTIAKAQVGEDGTVDGSDGLRLQITVGGEYIYNKQQHCPTDITVTLTNGSGMEIVLSPEDYEIGYGENVDAGTGYVYITFTDDADFATGPDAQHVMGTFEISPAQLQQNWFHQNGTVYYTGEAITVADHIAGVSPFEALTPATDYTLSSETVEETGTHTITITGTGNYAGEITLNFVVTARPVTEDGGGDSWAVTVTVNGSFTYNGQEQKPTVVVSVNGNIGLTAGTDYDIVWPGDCTNAGDKEFAIVLKGNYSGTVSESYTIAAYNLSNAQITGIPELVYNGKNQSSALKLSVSDTGFAGLAEYLGNGIIIDIPADMTAAGDYTVELTATNGNFTGGASAKVTIAKAQVDEDGSTADESGLTLHVEVAGEYIYNGAAQQPGKDVITVYATDDAGARYEVSDDDYTVTYGDNTNVGTGYVYVMFTDGADFAVAGSGSLEASFTIAPAQLGANGAAVTWSNGGTTSDDTFTHTVIYSGQPWTPQYSLTNNLESGALVAGTQGDGSSDYYVTVEGSDTDAGTITITLHGQGNYEGDLVLQFVIGERNVTDPGTQVTVTVDYGAGSNNYIYNGSEQAPEITVTVDGIELAESDYTLSKADDSDWTSAGTQYFTVTLGTNFSGSTEKVGTYEIGKYTLTDENTQASGLEPTYIYTGQAQQVGLGDVTAENVSGTLAADTDYTAAYEQFSNGAWTPVDVNAIAAVGLYRVTLTGIGTNFTGSATIEFEVANFTADEITGVTAEVQGSYVYNGSAQPVRLEVTVSTLVNGSTYTHRFGSDMYTIAYTSGSAGINAGNYTFTISLNGFAYNGTVTYENGGATSTENGTYTIAQAQLQKGWFTQSQVSYTGEPINIGDYLSGTAFGNTLTDGTDYTLSPATVTEAGTHTITITGAGNFIGTVEVTFEIADETSTEVSRVDVQVTSTHSYNGRVQTPTLVVTVTTANGETQVLGPNHYTVTYTGDRVNAGTAGFRVELGEGWTYEGVVTGTFRIRPADISNATFTQSDAVYTGSGVAVEDYLSGAAFGNVLANGTDYTLSPETVTEAGSHIITVTGRGNYTGTLELTFEVAPMEVTDEEGNEAEDVAGIEIGLAEGVEHYIYMGAAIVPEFEITVTLTDGTQIVLTSEDYEITNNDGGWIDVGTYSAELELKGNYIGALTAEFTIAPRDISADAGAEHGETLAQLVGGDSFIFTNEAITPGVTLANDRMAEGFVFTEGRDYTLTYADNVNAGVAGVTVVGTGNFTGSIVLTFNIAAREVTDDNTPGEDEWPVEIVVTAGSEGSFTYNGQEQKPTVTVKVNGDIELTAGTDYDIAWPGDCTSAGGKDFTITLKGNYSGEFERSYEIKPAELQAEWFEQSDAYYTGGELDIADYITGTAFGETLEYGTDYTWRVEGGAVDGPGAYEIVLEGRGNYTGELTIEFTVKPLAVTDEEGNRGEGVSEITVELAGDAEDYIYTGAEITPEFTVTITLDDGTELRLTSEDYEIDYAGADRINAAEGIGVYLELTGNYTGRIAAEFDISKYELSSGNTTVELADGALRVTAENVVHELEAGRDYTVTYYRDGAETTDVTTSGELRVVIEGIGQNFTGRVEQTLHVEGDWTMTKEDLHWLWLLLGGAVVVLTTAALLAVVIDRKRR